MLGRISTLLTAACVMLALVVVTVPGSQAAPIRLTYSNFFPPTHIQSELADAWCKEVEKRTNGRVVVEHYPGQTLTKARQCYDGVVTGLSDLGFSVLAYTRGRFPVMAAVDLPLGYPSGKVATAVANAVYQKFKPKELLDTQVMYLHAHGPGLLHTKGTLVRRLEDVKGLKIRGHGTSALVVKALGGTPVPKPMPETYQMLQKGVVDGAVYPMEANKGWKLGEVTDYVAAAFSAAYTTTFFVVMNKDKWNALPEDIKTIFTQISEEWIEKHGMVWDYYDKVGIDYFLTFPDREVIELSSEEMARWVETAVDPMVDAYISEKTALGLPAEDYQQYLLERVSYWSGKSPTAAESVAWVEAELETLAPAG
jgi:TRAP-type C4-dicarboxylate transport system substrate-binding protein